MSNKAVLKITKHPYPACHLICFPFAGAGPSVFRAWATAVPPWTGVWSARLAGREGRFDHPPMNDLKRQVEELVEAIRPLCDRPTVFYGHSLGATLAAHVAQELFRESPHPCALVVAARRSPWSRYEAWDRVDFAALSDSAVLQAYRELGAMNPALFDNPELLEIMLPTIRADAELATATPFLEIGGLSAPVHALFGREDPFACAGPVAEWRRFTTGRFILTEVDGGHLFMRTHPTLVQDVINPILTTTVRRGSVSN